jgi:hypothetical protein
MPSASEDGVWQVPASHVLSVGLSTAPGNLKDKPHTHGMRHHEGCSDVRYEVL